MLARTVLKSRRNESSFMCSLKEALRSAHLASNGAQTLDPQSPETLQIPEHFSHGHRRRNDPVRVANDLHPPFGDREECGERVDAAVAHEVVTDFMRFLVEFVHVANVDHCERNAQEQMVEVDVHVAAVVADAEREVGRRR